MKWKLTCRDAGDGSGDVLLDLPTCSRLQDGAKAKHCPLEAVANYSDRDNSG